MKEINYKSFSDKTIVISGFPGIGKSYCMKLEDGYNGIYVSDSDSSKFEKAGFPNNYLEHIKQRIKGNDTLLFVSSHKLVREALIKNAINFFLVYPNISRKGEYIQRFIDRGSPDAFIKLLFDNWETWVNECAYQTGCTKIELQAGQYLSNILKEEVKVCSIN